MSTNQKKDYYTVLGLSKGASEDEIKKAYRRLAMKLHPDRNPGDKSTEEKFKEAKEAYEVLSDSKKRAMYDQFGHAGVGGAAGGGAGGGGFGGAEGFDFEDLGGMFSNIFEAMRGGRGGGKGGGRAAERGSDLLYNIELNLEDAVHGKEVKLDVPKWTKCSECKGTGAKKGTTTVECKTCGGTGEVRFQQGFFTFQQTCNECHGEGKIIKDPCAKCHGQGRVQERKTLNVKIPPGVDDGDRVRLTGEGEAGLHGAPSGDLYVAIAIKKHPIFQRDNFDLYCEVPISFVTTALGGEIEVPTLDGKVKLKIPAETQSGKVFRLRDKGVKTPRHKGDLFCKVVVETPVKLNTEQKELLEKFAASLAQNSRKHSPRSDSWFDGVKKFFGV